LLLIVPSRKRPQSCDELLTAFEETAEDADILFGLDDDDKSEYSARVLEKSSINPRLRMGGTLNLLATQNAEKYEFLSFMGDDHRPRTQGWDRILSDAIGERPGVAYGDDLLQGVNLPTAVTMSAEIVRRIGYMVPPVLVHMYMDNFWRDFGVKIGNLQYRADVVIEHMHYLAGKAVNDLQYQEVNASHVYEKDRIAYEDYEKTQMQTDVGLVLRR
jgi:hypothetical protein